jgi:hypothetical protein
LATAAQVECNRIRCATALYELSQEAVATSCHTRPRGHQAIIAAIRVSFSTPPNTSAGLRYRWNNGAKNADSKNNESTGGHMAEDIARDLALKYARYVDDKTFDKMPDIMHPDVVMAAPEFESVGVPAFTEKLQILHDYSGTMHMIGNQLGDWTDGTYQGETYCIAAHIYEKDGVARKMEMGIRYKDTITAIDGVYKYSRRYLDVIWHQDLALMD